MNGPTDPYQPTMQGGYAATTQPMPGDPSRLPQDQPPPKDTTAYVLLAVAILLGGIALFLAIDARGDDDAGSTADDATRTQQDGTVSELQSSVDELERSVNELQSSQQQLARQVEDATSGDSGNSAELDELRGQVSANTDAIAQLQEQVDELEGSIDAMTEES